MYGFPLTLYVLSGWLQTKYPSLDLLSHNSGHLWSTLLGESGDPHFSPLHIASYIFIGGGFWLLSSAWTVLYHAQRHAQLAVSGPYARIRHPQYVAFVAILFGFLLQWPTLLTLLMFPFLVVMYSRLAVNEEKDMRKQFGAEFDAYAARTPRFWPRFPAPPLPASLEVKPPVLWKSFVDAGSFMLLWALVEVARALQATGSLPGLLALP